MKSHNRKINFIDILLVVIILTVLAVFLKIFFEASTQIDVSQKEAVTVTLRIKDIPVKHSDLIKNGDTVFLFDSEKDFGTVKYVNYNSESVEFLDKLTNTSTIYKSPDKSTALLLIEAFAEAEKESFVISGITINKSDVISLFTPYYSFDATVINVERN